MVNVVLDGMHIPWQETTKSYERIVMFGPSAQDLTKTVALGYAKQGYKLQVMKDNMPNPLFYISNFSPPLWLRLLLSAHWPSPYKKGEKKKKGTEGEKFINERSQHPVREGGL